MCLKFKRGFMNSSHNLHSQLLQVKATFELMEHIYTYSTFQTKLL